MNRRALISSLVAGTAGLAGCGGPESERQGYEVPDDDGGSVRGDVPAGLARVTTSTFGPDRRMAVSSLPGGSSAPGTETVAGFLGPATADSPPRLWVGATNVTEDDLTVQFGPTPPFSAYYGRNMVGGVTSARHLLLVPDDDREHADYDRVIPETPGNATRETDGVTGTPDTTTNTTSPPEGADERCWRADGFLAAPLQAFDVSLEPGDTLAGEYAVLWNQGIQYCPPRRGGYLFADRREWLSLVVSTWDPSLEPPAESDLERSVPSLPGTDGTVWFHRLDRNAAVYLEPDAERGSLPTAPLSVTFQNYSVETLSIDPGGWGLYRLEDGDWTTEFEPGSAGESLAIPPGGAHRVSLRLSSRSEDPGGEGQFVGRLSPGLYAVGHGTVGAVNTDGDTPLRVADAADDERVRIGYAALFELE